LDRCQLRTRDEDRGDTVCDMRDLLAAHRRVVLGSVAVVGDVAPGQLSARTPCTDWDLGELLAHMIGQHYGFAASARTARPTRAAYAPRAVGAEPAADYEAAARHVLDAFARPGLLDEDMYLPEVRGGLTLPARTGVRFHLVDYVVHSWDVSRTINTDLTFDPDVLDLALEIATAVPAEAKSTDPHTPFAPARGTTSLNPLDRIVAMLGRDPDWRAPTRGGSANHRTRP
jgi:uncharacterized protein (TIGR03086 family)